MSLNLKTELDLLHAAYKGNAGVDEDVLSQWPRVHKHIDENRLTLSDWEVIRQMFSQVAQTGQAMKKDWEWFWKLSRRFGSASHDMERRIPMRRKSDKPDLTVFYGQHQLDPLAFGALLYAFDLPGPYCPMESGIARYLMVPPDMRTHFTDQLLVLAQILEKLKGLKPEEMTVQARTELYSSDLVNFLKRFYTDLRDLLLEGDTHWALLYNAIQDELWASDKPIPVYRAHINMTTINEKDDTGFHGDLYLRVVREWLKERFPKNHVVQSPSRTSFLFLAPHDARVRALLADFSSDISMRLTSAIEVDPHVDSSIVENFIPRIVVSERVLSRKNLYSYAIQTEEDLEVFEPVIEYGNRFSVSALKGMGIDSAKEILSDQEPDFEGIRKSGNQKFIKTLNALILKATLSMDGVLAAQTTFFEKENDPFEEEEGLDSIGEGELVSEQTAPLYATVKLERDLPFQGSSHDLRWQTMLRRKTGYVGPGQYNPGNYLAGTLLDEETRPPFFVNQRGSFDIPELHWSDDPSLHPKVNFLLKIIPRLGRARGYLSHQRAGSQGLIEEFLMHLRRLIDLPSNTLSGEIEKQVSLVSRSAGRLLHAFSDVYSLAVTDPRNAWTPKQHTDFEVQRGESKRRVSSDFFMQEAALSQNTLLIDMEYDSLKAYLGEYPSLDEVDSSVNRGRDALFLAARQMNMANPIIRPKGGDHLSISISEKDKGGNIINPVEYCERVQQIVREMFAPFRFHDFNKVDMNVFHLRSVSGAGAAVDFTRLVSDLMKELKLNAPPTVKALKNGEFFLSVPKKDLKGKNVTRQKVEAWFRNHGFSFELINNVTTEVARLPIWTKKGGKQGEADYWMFGDKEPSGYEPFYRTMTVSLALGIHRPLQTMEDTRHFEAIEKIVSRELGRVKKSSWPMKEGFADARKDCPLTRKPPIGAIMPHLDFDTGIAESGRTGTDTVRSGFATANEGTQRPVEPPLSGGAKKGGGVRDEPVDSASNRRSLMRQTGRFISDGNTALAIEADVEADVEVDDEDLENLLNLRNHSDKLERLLKLNLDDGELDELKRKLSDLGDDELTRFLDGLLEEETGSLSPFSSPLAPTLTAAGRRAALRALVFRKGFTVI